MNKKSKEILEEIIKLCLSYANVYRGSINLNRYQQLVGEKIIDDKDFKNELIREPLHLI